MEPEVNVIELAVNYRHSQLRYSSGVLASNAAAESELFRARVLAAAGIPDALRARRSA